MVRRVRFETPSQLPRLAGQQAFFRQRRGKSGRTRKFRRICHMIKLIHVFLRGMDIRRCKHTNIVGPKTAHLRYAN
ncbi:hypothetical protein C9890_0269 [Perkinsus sp. BL_2016]|nr:hypothetical protein C9890_0269 [Perkinsus sp. BL_2016]